MKKEDFLEKYKGQKFESNGFRVCDTHVEVYFYADNVWVHCLFNKKHYNIHAFESTENIVRDFQEIIFVNDRRNQTTKVELCEHDFQPCTHKAVDMFDECTKCGEIF